MSSLISYNINIILNYSFNQVICGEQKMLKRLNVKLQTKIIILISLLIFFVITIFTVLFIYYEIVDERKKIESLALQTSKSISLLPVVKNPETNNDESIGEIQAMIHQIKGKVKPDYILIEYKNGTTYLSPDHDLHHDLYDEDNYKAIVFGSEYTIEAETPNGKIIWAKSPIKTDEYQQIIGVVSVGFFKKTIHNFIIPTLKEVFLIGVSVLTIGSYAGYLLSKSIRKQILGLEPDEIASLYTIRETILKSLNEGIISIDQKGMITLINKSAKEMLGISKECINKPIQEILPDFKMVKILNSNINTKDEEINLNNKIFIVSYTPIMENGKKVGVVASFRDKTDIQKMAETITEIKNYSEELRAQTHEFTNKLYVISGLLQLKQYDQVIDLIQEETNQLNFHNEIIFNQINDPRVQAILLGKLGKASEKKVKFTIDENSSLSKLPNFIQTADIVTIIGNLIDNAIEAVEQEKGVVTFFATDIGNDIIIEVSDNGKGFSDEEEIPKVFYKGVSSKNGKYRGYGLFNVKSVVDYLNGDIEIQQNKGNGTIFSVYIPKEQSINNGVVK